MTSDVRLNTERIDAAARAFMEKSLPHFTPEALEKIWADYADGYREQARFILAVADAAGSWNDTPLSLIRDLLAVFDGDEPDYSDCPWRLGTGICVSGCSQEPACADAGDGWPIERARSFLAEPAGSWNDTERLRTALTNLTNLMNLVHWDGGSDHAPLLDDCEHPVCVKTRAALAESVPSPPAKAKK